MVFWLDDLQVLYKNKNYLQFIPSPKTTRDEQLNAIARLAIYYIISLFIFDKHKNYMYIPIILLIFTIVLKKIHLFDSNSDRKDIERNLDIRNEGFGNIDNLPDDEFKDYNIETGFYDSDEQLHVGPEYTPTSKVNKSPYSPEEIREFNKATCRKPTYKNPFMNPNLTDYNNGEPPAACNSDDEDIKEGIQKHFNADLYRDVDDLWEKGNSQRQFYTIPSQGVPNNQTEFAEWLWKSPFPTCKEQGVVDPSGVSGTTISKTGTYGQSSCLAYEDLRYKNRDSLLSI